MIDRTKTPSVMQWAMGGIVCHQAGLKQKANTEVEHDRQKRPRFHTYARGRPISTWSCKKKDLWDVSIRTRPDQSERPCLLSLFGHFLENPLNIQGGSSVSKGIC